MMMKCQFHWWRKPEYLECVSVYCHHKISQKSPTDGAFMCWVIKGFGMSSLVYATGHIKDPVPLIEKRRGLSPGGRFPPSFIHQVIIIT